MSHYYKLFILSALLIVTSCKDYSEERIAETHTTYKQPNIIFIMADDHAEQAISAYGHPVSQLAPTPNIDRIAQNGAKFLNNFCTNSICGPSRAVILTGKFSHMNGFRMNGEKFDGSQATLPKYLHQAGYQTAITGKWHLDGEPQGFDYWNILKDQGNYYNPDFIKGKDTTRIEGYATDIITDMALNWLQNDRKKISRSFLWSIIRLLTATGCRHFATSINTILFSSRYQTPISRNIRIRLPHRNNCKQFMKTCTKVMTLKWW